MTRLWWFLFCVAACGGQPSTSETKAAPATKADGPTAPAGRADPAAPDPHAGLGQGRGDAPSEPTLADPEQVVRHPMPAPVGSKGAKSFGFRTSALGGLYALEAAVAAPHWGRRGKTPLAVRDDDLDTAWTCEVIEEAPCAFGMVFEDVATLAAVRLYAAAGPSWAAYTEHPRIAKVRVHTDVGFFEAELPDGAGHRYVLFDSPVDTRALTVEIVGLHAGTKGTEVHLAELEAFGVAGLGRPPLDLDPTTIFARYETTPWKEGEHNTIRQVFLEQASADGKGKRLMRGTAIHGNKGDRFLLVEKLFDTTCTQHDGSYLLLDQISRMVIPMGQIKGAPARILRHPGGLGFSSVGTADDPFDFTSVVYEGAKVKQRRASTKDKQLEPAALRTKWGFSDETPSPRSAGRRLDDPPAVCERSAEHAELVGKSGLAKKIRGLDPATVAVCDLGGGSKALLAQNDDCGAMWGIAVLGPDGALVGDAYPAKKQAGRGLRMASMPGVGLVVETTSARGAETSLHRLTPTGIELLAEAASFAVRPPARCEPCDDRFAL